MIVQCDRASALVQAISLADASPQKGRREREEEEEEDSLINRYNR